MGADQDAEKLKDWQQQQELAEAMVPLIGKMYRDHGVVTLIYGRPLIIAPPIDIVKLHRFVRQVEQTQLTVRETYPVVEAMSKLRLAPARIDVGQLAVRYVKHAAQRSMDEFLAEQLEGAIGRPRRVLEQPQDVVLYGFGRIGRLLARLLVERAGKGDKLRLRGVVTRTVRKDDLAKRASLLRRDSIHGPFAGSIQVDASNNTIIANGNVFHLIAAERPDEPDYTRYGIENAIVIDNTGIWKDAEGLGLHLAAKGVNRVILTAPAKGAVKNIVFGVNDHVITAEDKILSAASCTTNAITPVLKAVHDRYGIDHGHVETVHAFTNDQNLIDNYHKADRRGRGAPHNMVITSTGAATAVAKAIPELAGKLTGNAIRVPIPNVSLAILNLQLLHETSREEINGFLRWTALRSELHKQIDYSASTEIVSSDLVGSRYACVIDSQATIAGGQHCTLYLWYDNEFGYSCQVMRIVQKIAGISYPFYPKEERAEPVART